MSGGDRGGVGAMNALIKKTRVRPRPRFSVRTLPQARPLTNLARPLLASRPTSQIPMILICNDKSTPKMKPFQSTCAMLGFRKCVASCLSAPQLPRPFVAALTPSHVLLSRRPTVAEVRSRIMSIAFKCVLFARLVCPTPLADHARSIFLAS